MIRAQVKNALRVCYGVDKRDRPQWKRTLPFLAMKCRVKPGASSKRAGLITLDRDEFVVPVAARARDGAAN